MANREEKRNLETIPVGSLGIISLPGCKPLGEKVDQYLVKWRAERESEHKESLAFAGYQRDSYLLDAKVPRFGSGEAKGQILESVRGTDLYLLVDVRPVVSRSSCLSCTRAVSTRDLPVSLWTVRWHCRSW